MDETAEYFGKELDLFAQATNWKSYYLSKLRPYIKGDVLEVGTGIGGTTKLMAKLSEGTWTCLEPDPKLARRLESTLNDMAMPEGLRMRIGTTRDLRHSDQFDSIIYIDVLEHINEDARELETAGLHLRKGGYLIVLSPAHQWLFSPFDQSIGHLRRYNKGSLAAISPITLELQRIFYLDFVGLLASLANRLLLKQEMPTVKQIKMWGTYMIPISRILDNFFGYHLGKSIIGVWRRDHLLLKKCV